MDSTDKNTIGITLGDPAGIGAEIVFKALRSIPMESMKRIHLIGASECIEQGRRWLDENRFKMLSTSTIHESAKNIVVGEASTEAGIIQLSTLALAVKSIKQGVIAGLVTAPIHKQSIQSAGFNFPGHTEYLAHEFGDVPVAMAFLGGKLPSVLVTTHIPLSDVSDALSTQKIVDVTRLAIKETMGYLSLQTIGVLGINPHAGEQGLFGREEIEIITPAIETLRAEYPNITFRGPLPPDSAFRSKCDLFVAMYHDQALIPVKLIDFDKSVNVTLGLPFARTSPDHGVAYDIAGTDSAKSTSMLSAIETCFKLCDAPKL